MTLALAVPLGILLKNATKEELKQGKKYFGLISLCALFSALILLFLNIEITLKISAIAALLFIAIVSFISFKHN